MEEKFGDLTFLTCKQVFEKKALEIFKKYGTKMALTDFSIILGATPSDYDYISKQKTLENRTGEYFLREHSNICIAPSVYARVCTVSDTGYIGGTNINRHDVAARPVLPYLDSSFIEKNIYIEDGIEKIKYGEYIQQAVDETWQKKLEVEYQADKLRATGKTYTFSIFKTSNDEGRKATIPEYEHNGEKYARAIVPYKDEKDKVLSNGIRVNIGNIVWLKVQPIVWFVDRKEKLLVSEKGLFCHKFDKRNDYNGTFEQTLISAFIKLYFSKEIEPSSILKQKNSDNFDFRQVNEITIIWNAVMANIPLFIHGTKNGGIPHNLFYHNLETVDLPTVPSQELEGWEWYDKPPVWYRDIMRKYKKDPKSLKIIYFNNITSCSPCKQKIAADIILNREINGKWKIPDDIRIIVSSNDYNESIGANQLTEPIFNHFVHLYVKFDNSLKVLWAMTSKKTHEKLIFQNKEIHPAIVACMAYKYEEQLRNKQHIFKSDELISNLKKWELISHVFYKYGLSRYLREILPQEDILLNYYKDVREWSINEKIAKVIELSNVDEANIEETRDFVLKTFGFQLIFLFDTLWAYGNKKRMEKIAELRLLSTEKQYQKKLTLKNNIK